MPENTGKLREYTRNFEVGEVICMISNAKSIPYDESYQKIIENGTTDIRLERYP